MMLTFGEASDPLTNYDEPLDVNVGLAGQSEAMKPQDDKDTMEKMNNTPEGKALVQDFAGLGTIYGGNKKMPKPPNNDPVGAPAPVRPIGQPVVVPVKRLDIVMRKAHEQNEADYEPPLQQSQDKFWSGLKAIHEFFDVEPPELLDKAAKTMTGESVSQAPDLPLNEGEGIAEVES